MKAVILAGGTGTRLQPLTLVTNKHLLALYDRPVIYYSIEKLVSAGIHKIMIVTSADHISHFVKLLGSGQNFSRKDGKQVQIVYGIQNEPSGVAYGLYIAKDYVGTENCVLFLGDNIIEDDLTPHVASFTGGARVFLKEVPDPKRFGVAILDKSGNVVAIDEKPNEPKSNFAVTGLYMYDPSVFPKMIDQPKSERGEYEITYVNNLFIEDGTLEAVHLKEPWFDIGTIESLHKASVYMQQKSSDHD